MTLTEFKNKKSGAKIIVYENNGRWFFRHVRRKAWLRNAYEYGPFESEMGALESVAENYEFFKFEKVWPR